MDTKVAPEGAAYGPRRGAFFFLRDRIFTSKSLILKKKILKFFFESSQKAKRGSFLPDFSESHPRYTLILSGQLANWPISKLLGGALAVWTRYLKIYQLCLISIGRR